ncbi:hypothetical protein BKA65DRAFT_506014 [Rhexocercosporidium sp. MPI-PUGE-AT-0058]|nr:hypothetical protein BKA65DRAFT_506014 [Rhexocercosporidium sp. MPI-PUGE-AT-0058]
MDTLEKSTEFMQKSLTSAYPKIDKYAILLRPDQDTVLETETEREGERNRAEPRMIGLLGTVGDGTELVYMLHCDFWGKGYMTEALRAFVGKEGIFWGLKSKFFYFSHIPRS